jgi:hypothetical protein
MRGVDAGREVVGREMFGRVREQLDHEAARGSDASSVGAQRLERSDGLFTHSQRLPRTARNCKVFASGSKSGFTNPNVLECGHPAFARATKSPRASRAISEEDHMEPTSRRQFLKRGSAVAAAAGVIAAVPASAAKALVPHSTAAHEPERKLPNDASVDVPVVAHVRDVRKGLVSLYTGEREITIKNRRLAAALYHATH